MIIPIDSDTRIQGADMSWDVQKLHTPGEKAKNKTPTWKTVAYCTTALSALEHAFQRELRVLPTNTLGEALEGSESVREKYKPLLKLAYEVGRELA